MTTLVAKLETIQAALDTLARQHSVPGASLAVLQGEQLITAATGVVSKSTGVEVTPDTLFQIGSNTKVYTTTLLMQLVDEGLVDLDAPVKKYLPEFKLADQKAADKIVVRNLVTHTSGIEGDYFEEFGRGDDAIEKYVASLKDIGLVHPTNELWSYCNAAFVVAGRIIEKLRGVPYHQALRQHLLTPLGLNATTVLTDEMIGRRYAVGHIQPPGLTEPVASPRVMMSYSQAPAGSVTSATATEVLGFVKMHLDGGRGPGATRVLSEKSVRTMQEPQAKLPTSSLGDAMGLGWMLSTWSGERVISHGGGTIGQLSFMNVLPDRRLGVVLLTNSGGGGFLWRDLGRFLFDDLVGVEMPTPPKLPIKAPKVNLEKLAGTYGRHGMKVEVRAEDGKLIGRIVAEGAMAAMSPPQEIALNPIDQTTFLAAMGPAEMIAEFMEFDRSGRPTYLHVGGRAARRIPETTKAKSAPKKKGATKKKR